MRGRRIVRKTSSDNTNLEEIALSLKRAFSIDQHPEYIEFIPFKTGTPGFSIKREYPSTIRFKPAILLDGKPDSIALVRVVFLNYQQFENDTNNLMTPILVEIGMHERYKYNHYGYNYTDVDCPTKESLEAMKQTPIPVGYTLTGHYVDESYNIYNEKDKKVNGYDVLNKLFATHCSSTKRTKQLFWNKIADIAFISERLIQLCHFLLRTTYRKGFTDQSALLTFKKQDMIELQAKSLDIFGYQTSSNVIISYSFFILLLYTIKSLGVTVLSNTFFTGISNNPFLLLCFVLVTLHFYEHYGPYLYLFILNILSKIKYWCIGHTPNYYPRYRISSSVKLLNEDTPVE